jgi:hypothetical protein
MIDHFEALRLQVLQEQFGGEHGAMQLWVLGDDGLVRCGSLTMPEIEWFQRYGPRGVFVLRRPELEQ